MNKKDRQIIKQLKKEEKYSVIEDLLGNHIVTLIDIPDKNVTLVIDPTNPGIGIYKDNKIMMFNSEEINGLELETRTFITVILKGFDGIKNIKDYTSGTKNQEITYEQLKQEYGVEAQNEALKIAREKEFREMLKVQVKEVDINVSQSNNVNQQEITR